MSFSNSSSNNYKQLRAKQRGCSYEQFLAYRYAGFSGTEGPMRARKWITYIKRAFKICGCIEDKKVTICRLSTSRGSCDMVGNEGTTFDHGTWVNGGVTW